MQLIFHIEYRTAWGEQLVLRVGKERIALKYTAGDIWAGTMELCDLTKPLEYRYEVQHDGAVVRREWLAHTLDLHACPSETAAIRIRDRWQQMPDDSSFYSSAFVKGIFGREKSAHKKSTAKKNVLLCVTRPDLLPNEVLAIAGNGRELGDWRHIIPMNDSGFPQWSLELGVSKPFDYKFLIADRKTLTPILWEQGDNRRWSDIPATGEYILDAHDEPRFPARKWRGAGTAIPLFSLRSEEDFGIGEFHDLRKMIDWAATTGQRILQLLPINDTTMTGTWTDSYPYNANSTFALHPQFMHLPAAGVEQNDEYVALKNDLNALPEIDYEAVNNNKIRLLHLAFERHGKRTAARKDYKEFIAQNGHWLIPYAAFCTLRDEYGTADFSRWGDYARYHKKSIAEYCHRHSHDIDFYCYVQYHLHLQLTEMCVYARSRGIVLKGDLPIGISRTSVDAWLSPHLFHMDSQAGAPPDAFSVTGQNWGFPTYDWERMAQDDYAWWKARMTKMAEYFDAFRIDHILGFFRIWEIPFHAVRGLLGHFNPALPYSADELRNLGFDTADGRYTVPMTDDWVLNDLFGDLADEVRTKYVKNGKILPACVTQRQIAAAFPEGDDMRLNRLREGFMRLLEEVLFVEDPRRRGWFHPRIAAQATHAYQALDGWHRDAFNRIYDDFFYHRHNRFWQESALRKLPMLLSATPMLACGEDLGMIPDSVPETMRDLQILSLEIQRMPKSVYDTFGNPAFYPYLSVCTTSTHDMPPIRAWWEEDRTLSQRFYNEALGERGGAPWFCEPWICRRILEQNLAAPSMLAIIPLQDWLAIDGALRYPDPAKERINIPAIPRYYWRYRMHLTLEELLQADNFNAALRELIEKSGRF